MVVCLSTEELRGAEQRATSAGCSASWRPSRASCTPESSPSRRDDGRAARVPSAGQLVA